MAILKGEVTFKVTFEGLGVPIDLDTQVQLYIRNVLNRFMHLHPGLKSSIKRVQGLRLN